MSEPLLSDKWFPHQAELPPLPLPTLSDTCARYLETVKPLLTEEELAHTEAVVADFQREGGVGEGLQEVLEERAAGSRNWMEEWWEQLAYLRTRTTMAVHINWFGVVPALGIPEGELENVHLAALLLDGVLKMKARLEAGRFAVEKLAGRNLDMHQFSRVFGMTRVPCEGADTLEQHPHSRHIAVLRSGAVVTVSLYDARGVPLTLPVLVAQLRRALALADAGYLEDPAVESDDAHGNASLLTALPRDEWAARRTELLDDPLSARSLRQVESALFCVAFEKARPTTKAECARMCHGGTGRDKWFDKSFSFVVFENGRGGINAEHTPVDAMTITSMFVDVLAQIRAALSAVHARGPAGRAELFAAASSEPAPAAPPELLRWKLSAGIKATIEASSASIAALASDCELVVLDYPHYGKGFVKRCKLHPDFYVQMALQLATMKLHGHFVPTYETGHTRVFYHGRTDTVRTLSDKSAAFVREMGSADASARDKFDALGAACKAHGEQLQRVLSGQGVDRHMLGLMIASHLRGDDLPPIFSDAAYKRSGGGGNYRLSTSNVGYSPLFGGFAPMTADGYGVCYSMLEGRMNLAITAWRSCADTSATKFHDALAEALTEMRAMCSEALAEPPAESKL